MSSIFLSSRPGFDLAMLVQSIDNRFPGFLTPERLAGYLTWNKAFFRVTMVFSRNVSRPMFGSITTAHVR